MKIVMLMENGTIDNKLKSAHGLSMYIEHNNHKLLFDIGPNNNYIKNAKVLGIDLSLVDTVIISHGHFDHGSGLEKLMEINSKAKIYISDKAFERQVKKIGLIYFPIGIRKPKDMQRIIFVKEDIQISEDMKIYSKLKNVEKIIGDDSLFTKRNNEYIIDQFNHEIYLVIKEKDNNVLFSGCSHKGIENIINQIEKMETKPITYVLGGFHLSHYDTKSEIQTSYLKSLGKKLYNKDTEKYYSCHCTGDNAFGALKPEMKEKLERIKTGSVINL
ncbi:MAG: MBL fold metallo-hydrolase [Candidatus Izimaplasma sp.]|nr:MBL fold metallo-hydrolase [Candidatus Izimaplasma bacterium]